MPLEIAALLEGDPHAQTLLVALSVVDKQLGRIFFNEARRSLVMALPTDSGEKARAHVLLLLLVFILHASVVVASKFLRLLLFFPQFLLNCRYACSCC